MPRKRIHTPLRVLLNNRLVGRLMKEAGGAVQFQYDGSWLSWENAVPISLSLPLREDAYRGERIVAVCENLLPDSDVLRRRIAERTGAKGADAYNLLFQIGRDCVGALQFIPEDDTGIDVPPGIQGEILSDHEVEHLLNNLARAPLGLDQDKEFRISIAGAQEKTALLFHEGKWMKPHGTTPTTHILKPQIGTLPNGIDLSNSVENEYYCLRLMRAFGLSVNAAEIKVFGRFKLTPIYDVLTAQPSLDDRQIQRKQMKLAMSVGDNRHYRIDEVRGHHFVQTTEKAGLPGSLARDVLAEVTSNVETALGSIEEHLHRGFPRRIHESVKRALKARLAQSA